MIKDTATLYKLIVLYMLDQVNFPLTRAQIGDFLQDKDYVDFFTLQQVIAELIDTGHITAQTIRNRTQLSITEEGKNTLRLFHNRIHFGIKEDIKRYFAEHELELRNELSIQASYYKSTDGEYVTRLLAKDRGVTLVDITLSLPAEEIAVSVCDNWQKKNQEIYQYLTSALF